MNKSIAYILILVVTAFLVFFSFKDKNSNEIDNYTSDGVKEKHNISELSITNERTQVDRKSSGQLHTSDLKSERAITSENSNDVSLKEKKVATVVKELRHLEYAEIYSRELEDDSWKYAAEENINLKLYESELLQLTTTNKLNCKSTVCQLTATSLSSGESIEFATQFLQLCKKHSWPVRVAKLGSEDNTVVFYLPRAAE